MLTAWAARHDRAGVIKRGLIPAAALEPFVDQVWDDVAPAGVRRSEPSTWRDPGDRWEPSTGYHGSQLRWFGRDSRFWSGALGHDPDFLAATSHHPRMMRAVESLLGGPIRTSNRNRGVYAVFPQSAPEQALSPHVDNQSEELLATINLDTVGPTDGKSEKRSSFFSSNSIVLSLFLSDCKTHDMTEDSEW
jgi:hypothetical protein